jgi:ribonuclease HI
VAGRSLALLVFVVSLEACFGSPKTHRFANIIFFWSTATKDSKGIGVGMTVLSPPSETIHHESLTNIGPNNLVYNGELEGATLAAEYAAKIAKPRLHFHVYSDNQAGLWRLKTPSDNPGQSNQIRAIEATQRIIQKGGELTYHWVPGHTNVQGNERADTLAKAATFERPTSHQTSYAMLGLRMKQQRIREWKHSIEVRSAKSKTSNYHYSYRKRFEWKLQSKMLVPMGTQRKTASAFYQLKLGHGQFRSYLYQRGHVEDDMCYCGAKETPEHLLLVCPMYTGARCKLKDHLKENKPTLQQLLTTARGIEATLEFLNTTEIATRKWHLARENWGNEEEEE